MTGALYHSLDSTFDEL